VVERYNIYPYDQYSTDERTSPTGDWVRYEDYQALQAEIGILRTEKHADAEAIGHLQSQLAKAREDALREAAYVARNACLVPPDGGNPTEAEAAVCDEAYIRILALLDTPTPAPSPDALVKAALEWAAGQFDGYISPASKLLRQVATDPATVAAIIERAGE